MRHCTRLPNLQVPHHVWRLSRTEAPSLPQHYPASTVLWASPPPSAPSLSLAGVRLIIPDHALGLPVLRALSLCTCCRHYPGAAAGRIPRSSRPTMSAFPGRVTGSACTSSFSRLARRLLALRPAHSRGHQFVTAIRRLQPFRYLHDCSDCFRRERIAGWDLHPLESAALSRRTPNPDLRHRR